jgi:hypothetical protein
MSRFTWLAAIAAVSLAACSDQPSDNSSDANTAISQNEPADRQPSATSPDTHLSAYASACVDQGEWSLEMCQCMDREADAQLSVPAKAYLTATTLGDNVQANRIAQDNGARVGIEAIAFLTEGVLACH